MWYLTQASCNVRCAGRQVVSTDKAPGAVGPYSQAIKTGSLVFVSGQLGFIPGVRSPSSSHSRQTRVLCAFLWSKGGWLAQTKEFAAPDVEGQAEQVMLNLGAILEASGSSFGQVRVCLPAVPSMLQRQPWSA